MKILNRFNLPEPLVKVVENDSYRFDGDISTTGMLLPPRIYQLRKRHNRDIEEDVADNVWRLIGNNAHYILERTKDWYDKFSPGGVIIEKRFYADVLGWRIGGQIDLFEVAPCILTDWKVTSVWSVMHGIKPEHEKQLNINAWLMHEAGIHTINKLQIIALLRDWSKHKVEYGTDYPKCQVAIQEAKLRSYSKIKNLIYGRVKLHQAHENVADNDLSPCSEQERWHKDDVYAVRKKGRKSALRLLKSQAEAENWIEANKKGDSVECRKGEDTRCLYYCSVAPFCNQFRENQKN